MHNVRTEDIIIIDIETVTAYPNYDAMPESWQVLWAEKSAKILPEGISVSDFYAQRAGVMAEFSKIICISMGYFNKEQNLYLRIKSFCGHEEKNILEDFLATLKKIESYNNKWCFAGHNIKEFDIPFLCRRLLVNGIKVPSFLDFQNMKPWETNIVDTFQYWRFGDYKNYTSLQLLAACLNVPSPKNDMSGSMVGNVYWKEKDLNRIVAYCQNDVVAVANILLRFKGMPLLHKDDIQIVEK